MEKTVLNVEGMSCGHCANAVTSALKALAGTGLVQVDLEGKKVTVEYNATENPLEQIKSTINELGYQVV